jgi:hypothetical protein
MSHNPYGGRGTPADNIEIVISKIPSPPTIMRVRWLSRLDGLYVHYRKQRLPCGGQHCDSGLHRLPRSWIGYAPAEVLDTRRGLWFPTVVEITERLYWCLEGVTLRGTVWNLFRRPGRRDREECTGDLIDEVDPQKLRTDVDVQAAVRRLYGNRDIEWGKLPEMGRPQALAPSIWEEAPKEPIRPAQESTPPAPVETQVGSDAARERVRRMLQDARENGPLKGLPGGKDGGK